MYTFKTDSEKLDLNRSSGYRKRPLKDIEKKLVDQIFAVKFTYKRIGTSGDNFSKITMKMQKLGKSLTEIGGKLIQELS